MTTYVLVHGAWHGGWAWERVAAKLRAQGHEVHTPDLAGLGDRADGLSPEIGLRRHATELASLLESLDDVVLVGHSYGGFVVREAADRQPGKVRRIVLVDGWVGRDGESMDSRAPAGFRAWIDKLTTDGIIAVARAANVGVTEPEDVRWVESRMTPQPRLTFAEPTELTGAVEEIPCQAVLCVPNTKIPFGAWAAEFGWPAVEIASGHDVLVTEPDRLVEVLTAG
ncbi:alpha/beta hydrolase [Amycolatopsis acidicola]|uniref:Alpha/beta hydrolase n=1 Tax=Amycolatopsis acidicola TaxID=2596893 RepID=A0A5N0UUS3_9PSEU|nr:alpha/beta fold hydrolase [Amycolatopsis acidicola]KAA9156445.1 alpha/beta hydrolase [Amycolatopsis acidicola]